MVTLRRAIPAKVQVLYHHLPNRLQELYELVLPGGGLRRLGVG